MGKENRGILSFITAPREHIRTVVQNKSVGYMMLVSFLAIWATNLLSTFQSYNYELIEDSFSYQSAFKELIESALYSLGEVLLGLTVYAGIVLFIGKLFKGKGMFIHLYKGSMATMLPFIILLPILAVWLVISPESFYGMNENTLVETIFVVLVLLVTFFALIVSSIYCIIMVAEIHQISKWKAFFVICLTMIVLTVVFLILLVIAIVIFILYEAMK